MNVWIERIEFFLCGAMLLLMVLGLSNAVIMPGIDRWNKRFFVVFFATLVLCVGACFADSIVYRDPDMALAESVATFFEYLLAALLMPMLTVYLVHCRGEDLKGSVLFRTALALFGVYVVMLAMVPFTTCFYYISADNRFCRGSWHPLLLAPIAAIMLLNTVGVVRGRHRLSRKRFIAFLTFQIPMTAAVLVHMFIFTPLFVTIGIALCALTMFEIILSDQIDQYLRQQREIARQRASIMVLQMRPHFIYNTMTSIYYLCDQDPKKAQQVTLDFTTYLRKNFTAIASEDTIPFTEELEHARAYLAVEQAQYEDGFFVDYDTPHTRFRVPPLTLQPIVENAVKHGMDPEAEPLRILIRTRATDSGHEIIV